MTHAEDIIADIGRGDVATAEAFIASSATPFPQRRSALQGMLKCDADDPVAAVLANLFGKARVGLDTPALQLRDIYLRQEAGTPHPRRAATHLGLLTALSIQPGLPERTLDSIFAALSKLLSRPAPASLWSDVARITAALVATNRHDRPERLIDVRLMRAAARVMDFETALALAELWLNGGQPAAFCPALNQAISIMVGLGTRMPVKRFAVASHHCQPDDPLAIHNLARILDEEYVPFAEIVKLYDAIRPGTNENQYRQTLAWAARRCFAEGLSEQSLKLYDLLPAGDWAGKPHDIALQQRVLTSRDDDLEAAEEAPKVLAYVEIEFHNQPLGELVRAAAALAFRDKTYDGPDTAQEIDKGFSVLLDALKALPLEAVEPIADSHQAAIRLQQIANAYFAQTKDLTLYSDEPKYGLLSIAQMQAAHRGLINLVIALVERGMALVTAGRETAGAVEISRLIDIGVRCNLILDRPAAALALIAACEGFGMMKLPLARLKEACFLHQGDMAGAAATLDDDQRNSGTLLPIVSREDWTAQEDLHWQTIASDDEVPDNFDVVWPNGDCKTYAHALSAIEVKAAHHAKLTVMWGEVVKGAQGSIIRAQRMHYTRVYPTPDVRILNQGLRGLRWRKEETVHVDHQVVVLETFDALRHLNYYHWVIFLLSRIHLAKRMGYLDSRKLVVTEGLSSWMIASMQTIGIGPEMLTEISLDKTYVFSDAMLISSVEDPSRSILGAMTGEILSRCEPAIGEPVAYYLSRGKNNRRSILNAGELEDLAARIGYTIIRPEEHSFLEQARMFHSARCIAAPEGAALTNTIFCPAGTQILTFLSQNEMFPFFNDLSIMMKHRHRKIACAAERDEYGAHYIWAPYAVDLAIAEKHLRWAFESSHRY